MGQAVTVVGGDVKMVGDFKETIVRYSKKIRSIRQIRGALILVDQRTKVGHYEITSESRCTRNRSLGDTSCRPPRIPCFNTQVSVQQWTVLDPHR